MNILAARPDGRVPVGDAFTGINGEVRTLAMAPDGGSVAGGTFLAVDGRSRAGAVKPMPAMASGPGFVRFSSPTFAAAEEDGRISVIVLREQGDDSPAAVDVLVSPLSATENEDYEVAPVRLVMEPGTSVATFDVRIVPDTELEGTESVRLVLRPVTPGLALGVPAAASLELRDARLDPSVMERDDAFRPAFGTYAFTVDASGRLLAGKDVDGGQRVVRVLSDGRVDAGFTNLFLRGWAQGFEALPDGTALAFGAFDYADGRAVPGVLRLREDGGFDPDFQAFAGWKFRRTEPWVGIQSAVLDPELQAVVAGRFTLIRGAEVRSNVVRLLPNGTVDERFTPHLSLDTGPEQVIRQPDGRLLVGLRRLCPDGRPDETFVPRLLPHEGAYAMALQPDGRILLATLDAPESSSRQMPKIIRLNPDGTRDPSFRAITGFGLVWPAFDPYVTTLSVGPEGGFLVSGLFDSVYGLARYGLARFHADGALDLLFDSPLASRTVRGLRYRPLVGRLVYDGTHGVFVSLYWDAFDGKPGFRTWERFRPIASQAGAGFRLGCDDARTSEADGELRFDVARSGSTLSAATVAVQTMPVTAAMGEDFDPVDLALAFRPGERRKTLRVGIVNDRKIEPSESFVVELVEAVGAGHAVLARQEIELEDDDYGVGFVEPTYRVDERAGTVTLHLRLSGTTPTLPLNARFATRDVTARAGADYQSDHGGVVFSYRWGVVPLTLRLYDDPDVEGPEAFEAVLQEVSSGGVPGPVAVARVVIEDDDLPGVPSLGADGPVRTMIELSDGRLMIGGEFATVGGLPRAVVARLSSQGASDPRFEARFNAGASVWHLAEAPHHQVYVLGRFATVDGEARSQVVRLDPDGSLDRSFTLPDFPAYDTRYEGTQPVKTLLVQPDGRVLLGGSFTHIGGAPRAGLARLNPDGSVDPTFVTGLDGAGVVNTMVHDSTGRVLVGGSFAAMSGTGRNGLARLRANGEADPAFRPGLRGLIVYPLPDAGPSPFPSAAEPYESANNVRLVEPLRDGSIVVVRDHGDGAPQRPGDAAAPTVARLLPDGRLDRLFRIDVPDNSCGQGSPGWGLYALESLEDGATLIGGNRTLLKATPAGSSDPTFEAPEIGWPADRCAPGNAVRTILATSQGDLWIGGDFLRIGGESRYRLAKASPAWLGPRPPRLFPPVQQLDGTWLIVADVPLGHRLTVQSSRDLRNWIWRHDWVDPNRRTVRYRPEDAAARFFRLGP